MRHWLAARLGRLALSTALVLTAGCIVSVPLTRPEEDVTPGLPADEGDPADTDRSLSNHPPTADAGPDAAYDGGSQVVLDGTGSSDDDGDALAYGWEQVGGAPAVEFTSSTSASFAEFTAPTDLTRAVTLTFRLRVSDGFAFDADDIRITIWP